MGNKIIITDKSSSLWCLPTDMHKQCVTQDQFFSGI